MLKNSVIGVLNILTFFSSTIMAASDAVFDPNLPLEWASIVTLSGGPVWGWTGKSQTLYPVNIPLALHFDADKKTTVLGSGELFFGLQRVLSSNIIGQFGIGGAGASDARLSGTILANNTLAINSYTYKVNHARVEFKGKFILASVRLLQPYVSGSLGAAFNHAHDYQTTIINSSLASNLNFIPYTKVGFTYTLGAGVQKMLNPNWQVGVGYEFADWGKNYLGTSGVSLKEGPGSAHLYTNELLFSVSYLF